MSDLKRVKELLDSGEEDLAVGRACRLIRECRRAEIARWLFNYAGADSDREKVYHTLKRAGWEISPHRALILTLAI